MYEVGGGVVPDAARAHLERRLSQLDERHVPEPDVDRLTLHVQAAGRDALAPVPEHGVGGRGAIARDHLKRLRRGGDVRQAVQEIEQPRIDDMYLLGPKIAEEVVDCGQRIRQIRPAAEVLDGESLAGVGMCEVQGPAAGCPRTRGADL